MTAFAARRRPAFFLAPRGRKIQPVPLSRLADDGRNQVKVAMVSGRAALVDVCCAGWHQRSTSALGCLQKLGGSEILDDLRCPCTEAGSAPLLRIDQKVLAARMLSCSPAFCTGCLDPDRRDSSMSILGTFDTR